ncbi:hypothetical protein [Comamonas terrigena]|uniref:hypothetical protein n=1 Tax=Comamonas terrigena TaxID=32013 RepID=UPI0028A21DC5|nr:hypothetical protein [Comamonas terrigena]
MRGWFSRLADTASSAAEPAAGDAPQSYAQWSKCLDALAKEDNDASCLLQLESGQLEWTAGVAPMLGKRISEEVQRRLQRCSDRLARDLRLGAQETQIVRAVLQGRVQLGFVHRLCQLPVLPETTQQHLQSEVRRFAERAQKSLEDTAKADRSGQLSTLLRNNPLTGYERAQASPSPAPRAQPSAAPSPTATLPLRPAGAIS